MLVYNPTMVNNFTEKAISYAIIREICSINMKKKFPNKYIITGIDLDI